MLASTKRGKESPSPGCCASYHAAPGISEEHLSVEKNQLFRALEILEAAGVSLEYELAMARDIIYATAARHRAEIITLDADFEGLPGVTRIR